MAPDPKGIILVSTSASIIRVYGLETAAHGRVLPALTLCKRDALNASVVQNLPILSIVVPLTTVDQNLYYRILTIQLVNQKKELQWRL